MVPRYRVFAKAGVKAAYGGWYDTAQMFYEIRDIDFYSEEVTVWGCHQKNCGMCDDTYKMEDVEIMMSTRLEDKNGIEIFEGDVVKIHRTVPAFEDGGYSGDIEEDLICIVELSSYMPHIYPLEWFLRDVTDDEEPENYWFSPGLNEESYEVIGNIYENPELAEVE